MTPSPQPTPKLFGEVNAMLLPGNPQPAYVFMQAPKPCITILVHGVNDLTGVYADIEQGICQGLTERLDNLTTKRGGPNIAALVPATYSLPTKDHHSAIDPDAVYYRRKPNVSADGRAPRSVVIPFYWGFREEEAFIQKDKPHGEWLDRYGNRLDKAGTQEGGQFANATTTLPDMWGEGFNGMLFGIIAMNAVGGSPTYPLMNAPNHTYMVLAAKRLAMLVRIIRKQYPDDTINVVAHSQGTMLTLLANAFLKDEGQRPTDGAVLMNSPYSLTEPAVERYLELHGRQQTTPARLDTLAGIVDFIGAQPHPTPSMADMADPGENSCIGGLRWTGADCVTTLDGIHLSFDERDNRGNVTLYFTPQDHAVGLPNVQGIGWQGVPEIWPAVGHGQPPISVLSTLGMRFHQRVFTMRKRQGIAEDVGAYPPPHRYVLRQKGEGTWTGDGSGWFGHLKLADLTEGQSVILTAPMLSAPCAVNFDTGGTVYGQDTDGIHQVRAPMDPIEASVAITNGDWHKHSETPSQARERLMATPSPKQQERLSFHSAIPANPMHSRKAMAYDLAIGQAWSLDNDAFYAYLRRVADWRLSWKATYSGAKAQTVATKEAPEDLPDAATMAFYYAEDPDNRKLIDATATYHSPAGGTLECISGVPPPTLVISYTRDQRAAGVPYPGRQGT